MPDYLVKATAAKGQIRAFAVSTKTIVETARTVHHTSPVVTQALGRLLTAGALMGSMIKNRDELLTLKINGDGPIKGLLVTADSQGNVKGYSYVSDLKDTTSIPMTVSDAIGSGSLTIIKDMGLKEPYVGYSPLVSGEIAEDLTYYYAKSEQIPTSVSLGVLLNEDGSVKQAGGFIIQLMPFTDEEMILKLENVLADTSSMTKLMDAGKTPEAILKEIFVNLDLNITTTEIVRFFCNCSRDRVTKALIAIGEAELEDMIADGESTEINCDFCSEKYVFSTEDLQLLLNAIRKKEKETEV
ncbi:Hsp33 family molecular chaperone HslO [Acetobacterium sp.]|uniref:Hsp33 family molecular chaperone HslO n=1 Tax=Acetobacterium sp. TaxID=1872094 RepID=UPI002F3FC421